MSLRFEISFYTRSTDTTPSRRTLTWSELAGLLTAHVERADKDGPLWTPARFKPGTTRANANVEDVGLFVGDLDHVSLEEVNELRQGLDARGVAWVMHSTHSSSLLEPRLRLVMPLHKAVSAGAWAEEWAKISHHVLGDLNDGSAKDPSRGYYLPSRPADSDNPLVYSGDGEPLDWESLPPLPPEARAFHKVRAEITDQAMLTALGELVVNRYIDPPIERNLNLWRKDPRFAQLWARNRPNLNWPDGEPDDSRYELSLADWLWWEAAIRQPQEIVHICVGWRKVHGLPVKHGPRWYANTIVRAMHRLRRADHEHESKARLERVDHLIAFITDTQDAGAVFEAAGLLAELSAAELGQAIVRLRKILGKSLNQNLLMAAIKEARQDGDTGLDELLKRYTEKLARIILVADYFAQDAGGKLWLYKDGAYRPGGEPFIKQRVKHLLADDTVSVKWSTNLADEVVEYIRVDAPLLWERPPLHLVNVLNGLLDVAAGELLPHDPEHLSPIQLPVIYDPEASCPATEAFVATVFPEDAQDVAWEVAAWLMTPDTSIQKAFMLVGEGSNGKSTWLEQLRRFIDPRNCAALSLQKLEQDRFAVARLVGKLVNVCPDLPAKALAGTSMFKALTGGDRIAGEYKFKDSFEFEPYCRLIFSSNAPPTTPDASFAFFRRWLVIPFNRTFEEDDPDRLDRRELDAMLADPRELSGVLNKALIALPRIREQGFTESLSMREAFQAFRETTDPLAVWLEQHVLVSETAYVSKEELRRAYRDDCRKNSRPMPNDKAFALAMKRIHPNLSEAYKTIAGERRWCYEGIGLRHEQEAAGEERIWATPWGRSS